LELTALSQFKTFQWSTGASTKSIQVKSPGAYWLKATDDNGCAGNDTIMVVPKQCGLGVYIPTAFTPNNDGSNDNFRPGIFGNLLHYRLTIFNRWGNVVFQSTDAKRGWDGKVNGELQPSSVFVWICDYQLEGIERKAEKGSLVLIR
ncbi:MAG TPA: gliding motility-associated C-terminal domain-containing protein, partial [Flavisolibacter sp.]